jgi:hypothetical protein
MPNPIRKLVRWRIRQLKKENRQLKENLDIMLFWLRLIIATQDDWHNEALNELRAEWEKLYGKANVDAG